MNALRRAALPALVLAVTTVAVAAAADAPPEAVAVVDRFHAALAAGEREQVLELLDPQVVILEQGYVESSREEYAEHHLGSDLEFARSTRSEAEQRWSGGDERCAWVLTRSRIRGEFGGKTVDVRSAESALLRHSEAGWRIVHLHWSSHASR